MAGKKKKNRTLFVLAGVIVILLLVYAAVELVSSRKEAEQDAQAQSLKLFECRTLDVTKITFRTAQTEMTLVQDEELNWIREDQPEFPLNTGRASLMASTLASLTAERKVADSVEDLSPYGLDDPIITIEMESKAGSAVFFLGGRSAKANSFYLQKEGDPAIYEMTSDLYYTFNRTETQMMKVEEVDLLEKVSHILVERKNDRTLEFSYDENGNPQLLQPYPTAQPMSEDQAAELVRTYRSITFEESEGLAKDVDLAAYGLDEAAVVVTVTYQEEETGETAEAVLRIGDRTEEGDKYYVLWEPSGRVYTMNEDNAEAKMEMDPFHYVLAQVYQSDRETVTAAEKNGTAVSWNAEADTALAQLELEREASEKNETSEEAVLKLTVSGDQGERHLAFYPYDGKNFYLLEEEGNRLFLVGLREVDAVIAELEK